jgi:DNA-binding transcriptional LysR family regulator
VSFRRGNPGIDIRLTIANTSQALRAVDEGLVEIGFVEGAAVDHPNCATRMLVAVTAQSFHTVST